MESIFHFPARPLSPRPPAPHISFSPESCLALRTHRFRLPPSSRQVGRTRPASGHAALQRLSRRIRAKEGGLQCEATTNPCHPCDPRTVPLSIPNIVENADEIRTTPRTLPRYRHRWRQRYLRQIRNNSNYGQEPIGHDGRDDRYLAGQLMGTKGLSIANSVPTTTSMHLS